MEVMAALYFQAELEQAGVIPVAEVLVEARFQLQVRDQEAARRLESFAQDMQQAYYPRPLREQVFARTFGLGTAAVAEAGMTINREFETRFGNFCTALERLQGEARWAPPTTGATVGVETAVKAVLANLARRRFGNTLVAAQQIQRQLKAALELLNHPGVTTLFQARNIWGVIRTILGADTPDLVRLIDRGQAGMRIMGWVAARLVEIRDGRIGPVLTGETSLFIWAANWLQASGYAAVPAQRSFEAQGKPAAASAPDISGPSVQSVAEQPALGAPAGGPSGWNR